MKDFEPAYMKLIRADRLAERIEKATAILSDCVLCPRRCRVNRLAGETGVCKTGAEARVSSHGPHFGEESPLVGSYGSGTIFITHCNLMCVFCQNHDISHEGKGEPAGPSRLAWMMLRLQHMGCHNINFVTPSHVTPQILAALAQAAAEGLNLPLVYNSGGYDSVDTLKLLDGVFDIYMPDFKFWDPDLAGRTCHAPDYPEAARAAIAEMHRQVGDLTMDDRGIAARGLLVRHLVLPGGVAGTPEIMGFLAGLSPDTYVNVMSQYRPLGGAGTVPEIAGYPSKSDFNQALADAKAAGLRRLDPPRRVFMVV